MFKRTIKKLFAFLMTFVGLPVIFSLVGSSAISAQVDMAYVRHVRAIETGDLGVPHPAGLAFSSGTEVLLVVEARRAGQLPTQVFDVIQVSLVEDRAGSARIAASIGNPINMTFDSTAERLLFLRSARSNLFEVRVGPDGNLDPTTLRPYDAQRFGLQDPQGLTVDPASGDLFILDRAGPRLVRLTPDATGGFDQAVVSSVDLGQTGLLNPRGVAFDPTTGHLHVLSPAQSALYEVTPAGQVVAVRDLTGIALGVSQGMVFAPSGDLTDDPAQMSLYLADSGQTSAAQSSGQIVELSLVEPMAPVAPGFASTLVNTIDTSLWSPPSPDPSGIAYLDSSNTLLVSDAEVEETVQGITHFEGANLFETTLTGTLVYTANISSVAPTVVPMSDEPAGVSFDPVSGHLFFSDDDADEVYDLNPGPDGQYGTTDDTFSSFDTRFFGNNDAEGIAFGQGHLFVTDGVNREVYQYTPSGSLVGKFDVAGIGLLDPEGLDYNSVDGTLFIADHGTDLVAETTISGTPVLMIDISAANARHVGGVAYAPGSMDPGVMSLYIADRQVDNNSDPNIIDGKVYELSTDPSPVVVFSAATYNVDEGAGTITVTVNLFRRSSTDAFSVDFATSDGTAIGGSDYTPVSGTLTFDPGTVIGTLVLDPGETSETFSVPITNDALDEANETITLTLSNPTNPAILGATAVATLTITDDDDPPTVQFDRSTYNVNEAVGAATITTTLSAPSGLTVTVDYATGDGTATAGSDYTAVGDTLTFAPGQISQTFSVPIANDTLDELDETVDLTLSNLTNAAPGTPISATLTILDDDAPPSVQFSSAAYSVNEGGSTATITATLNAASGLTVTVGYATGGGTATAGSDYTAVSNTLTFAPGQTSQTFSVPILEDALDESNETVNLTLSSPSNATLGTASATLTIFDNDPAPSVQFSAADFSVAESGGMATITVFLSPASGLTVTVDYASADGTATAGSDYTAVGGTLAFVPGETIQTFSVPILEDALDEPSETVDLTLSNFSNAVPGTPISATLTIVDDDSPPTVQFSSAAYSVNEGGSTATITVTLSSVPAQTVTVDYATSDGTATAGSDYTAVGDTLTFAPGQISQTFSVPITNDALDEADETVDLTLSNFSNAAPGTPTNATLTIVDNDGLPSVQFSSSAYTVAEQGGTATITVTLSAPSGQTVMVNYATSDGTATAGVDYTAVNGTLIFAPGETSQTFSVPITNDTLYKPDKTVILTLSNPVNAALGAPANATLTIIEDDPVRIYLPLVSR